MRIALSMRVTNATGYDEPRDSISHDWIDWVQKMGHTPVPVPNSVRDPGGYMMALDTQAVILTGGNDVVKPASGDSDFSARRNEAERLILDTAIDRQIPVFGVCRGMHVINQYFGGGVVPDISHTPVRHVNSNHPIHLRKPFADIAETPDLAMNSFHNQAVPLHCVATNLRVLATSEADNLVEGIFHPERSIIAIQWHPERPNPGAAFDTVIFKRLLSDGPFWSGGK